MVGGPDIREIHSAKFPIEYCRWRRDEEMKWLRTADIGIMPLVDNAYEQGKCAFKLIQYFSAGLPVVASPVGMNREVVRPGGNGILAALPEEWERGLGSLIADPGLRRSMGRQARERFIEDFTRERHARRWADLLRQVAERPKNSVGNREGV
jgi:glycosyltransferase involved in cell wall biosynthesis